MPAAIVAGSALNCDLIASILNPNSAFSATPVTKLKSQANSYWFLTHSSGEWRLHGALQPNSGALRGNRYRAQNRPEGVMGNQVRSRRKAPGVLADEIGRAHV